MATIDTRTTHVVPLDHPLARQPAAAGSKAAHLARAAGAGLPVLPGSVILHSSESETPDEDGLTTQQAWRELSADGTRPLVVRSSSPQEDTHESSMAGQSASVLDVRGWDAFRAAVRTVLDSARRTRSGPAAHMAVLVQPMLTVRAGGVLFTADPLTARLDRMLVSAVDGGPDTLVSGARSGTDYHLTRRGRLLRTEPPGGAAADQSRPITGLAARPARGASLLGDGYRRLARLRFTTVVDLRAEDLTARQLALPERAGPRVVRLPIRDGQTPEPGEVDRFLDVVRNAPGRVFVHCGAGVGRTGTMSAAYLVRTGEQTGPAAARRNLAVGPPSLEQICYALTLTPDRAAQPPLPVVALSRLIDAPRRIWSRL
ncbi:PEP/pyruvate-binding domain-containing protein [Streptomyces sp. NBS 14/10]|uniref:phosphatase domain-containing putative toxin n=1 Tax=Streptomyces sp. NBS 14/10 TaxID=1945643 RepID=UPI000B7E4452